MESSYLRCNYRHRPIVNRHDSGTSHENLSLRECRVLARRLQSWDQVVCTLGKLPSRTPYGIDRPSESLSIRTGALKHVNTKLDVEGGGSIDTQRNGMRTATGVSLRSVSKISSGRIKWNAPRPSIISTLAWPYLLIKTGSMCGYCCLSLVTSVISVPTLVYFFT